jgi:hypothetical protein
LYELSTIDQYVGTESYFKEIFKQAIPEFSAFLPEPKIFILITNFLLK